MNRHYRVVLRSKPVSTRFLPDSPTRFAHAHPNTADCSHARSMLQACICANGCANAYSVAKKSPQNPPTSRPRLPCSQPILTPSRHRIQPTRRKTTNQKFRLSLRIRSLHPRAMQRQTHPRNRQRSVKRPPNHPRADLPNQGLPNQALPTQALPRNALPRKPLAVVAVAAVADAALVAANKPSPRLSLRPPSKDRFL